MTANLNNSSNAVGVSAGVVDDAFSLHDAAEAAFPTKPLYVGMAEFFEEAPTKPFQIDASTFEENLTKPLYLGPVTIDEEAPAKPFYVGPAHGQESLKQSDISLPSLPLTPMDATSHLSEWLQSLAGFSDGIATGPRSSEAPLSSADNAQVALERQCQSLVQAMSSFAPPAAGVSVTATPDQQGWMICFAMPK